VVVEGGWVEEDVYCLLKDRLVQGIVYCLLFIDLTTRCTRDFTKGTRKNVKSL